MKLGGRVRILKNEEQFMNSYVHGELATIMQMEDDDIFVRYDNNVRFGWGYFKLKDVEEI